MTNTTFVVSEMSCGHRKKRTVTRDPYLFVFLRNCAFSAVEGELNKLSGVERSNANFEKGIAEVCYDENRVSDEQLKEATEVAGYAVVAKRLRREGA